LFPAVDAACREVGRDPTTLARSVGLLVELPGTRPYPPDYPAQDPGPGGKLISGTAEELADTFRAFARIGVTHLQIWLNPTTPEGVERLAETLRLLDED
jgi:hypothetical protein